MCLLWGWEFPQWVVWWAQETLPIASIVTICLTDSLGLPIWTVYLPFYSSTSVGALPGSVGRQACPAVLVSLGSLGLLNDEKWTHLPSPPCLWSRQASSVHHQMTLSLCGAIARPILLFFDKRDPHTPTTITTRSHKHSPFLSDSNVIWCWENFINKLGCAIKKKSPS